MTAMASKGWRERDVSVNAGSATMNEPALTRPPYPPRQQAPVTEPRARGAFAPVSSVALPRQDVNAMRRDFWYAAIGKRVLDLGLAGILLVLALPVLAVAAIWIVADARANPFFTQRRIGRDGVPFRLLKLRTMDPSSTGGLAWLIDERGIRRHKIRNDPRVTRPGRFLRRTSIDELPQLWNVLRGEMSLVGPRPELPEIVAEYDAWQHARHTVRPGLTGWWQVSGRSDAPMHEHTELDLYYVDRISPRLDFLIALKTVRVVLKGLGAF